MKTLTHWLIDYLYVIKGYAKTIFYIKPPSHYLGFVLENKFPVVLIPGVNSKWVFLKRVGDRISLTGHPTFIVPALGHNTKDIQSSAKVVKELIDKNHLKNVILITHSKGGIIGKYLLVHENQDNSIKGMVAIASPFSGTRLVNLIPLKSYRELSPKSPIIKDLDAHKEVNNRIISIFPCFDNHVWSEKGSRLEGAKNIQIEICGHTKILFTKVLEEKVLESVKELSS